MFRQVRIVLVNTTHPGNIGAAARAIKNMGFSRLYLVEPHLFPSEEATARASGAEDVLENAIVTHTLDEALEGCKCVIGLSARTRKIAWPTLDVRIAANKIVQELKNGQPWEQKQELEQVALVFGQEQSGLLNEELAKCHFQVTIPANPAYPSLNLAQAVQILTYECRMAILTSGCEPEAETELNARTTKNLTVEALATMPEMECFYDHLEQVLIGCQFLDPKKPRHLMQRLRRLYAKARVDKTELNILQGILTAIKKKLQDFQKLVENVDG